MSLRDKFFNAMRRKSGEYIPFEFQLCPHQLEEFQRRTGNNNYVEHYQFPVRNVQANFTGTKDRFSSYYKMMEKLIITDWGVGKKPGSVAHFTEMQHAMKDFETIEEFEAYPYPNPIKDYDWDRVPDMVAQIKEKDLIAVAQMEVTIFEMAWNLRGIENFMIDMVINPELANYHLERITEIRCEFAKRYAKAGCDVLRLGDDVSTQLDMMMNPEMWRTFLKPRLARVIKAAKDVNPDILIFYHGDGNLQKIIPELIEIGIDILNPVQPECMNPVEIKQKYGDKLSFWGTLGTQTTLPFGSAEHVRRVCKEMIEKVGNGGGLFLSPTHVVEPEVPWENIQAFIETICEYNCKQN